MPITKSAIKALRQDRRRTEMNRPLRTRMKTASDTFKKTKTPEALAGAFSAVDVAVKRNIIHKNKAARIKSALAKLLQ